MSNTSVDQYAAQLNQCRLPGALGNGNGQITALDLDSSTLFTGMVTSGRSLIFVGLRLNNDPNKDRYSLVFRNTQQEIYNENLQVVYLLICTLAYGETPDKKYIEWLQFVKKVLVHLAISSPTQAVNNTNVFVPQPNGAPVPANPASAQFANSTGQTPTMPGIGYGNTTNTTAAGMFSTVSSSNAGFNPTAPSTGFSAPSGFGNQPTGGAPAFPGDQPTNNGFNAPAVFPGNQPTVGAPAFPGNQPTVGAPAFPANNGFAAPTNNGFPGNQPTGANPAFPTNNGFAAPTNNGFAAPTNNGFAPPTNNGFAPPPSVGAFNQQGPPPAFGGVPAPNGHMLGMQPAANGYNMQSNNDDSYGPKSLWYNMWMPAAAKKAMKSSYGQVHQPLDHKIKVDMVRSLIRSSMTPPYANLISSTASDTSLGVRKSPFIMSFKSIPRRLDDIPNVIATMSAGNDPTSPYKFGTATGSTGKILDNTKGVTTHQQAMSILFQIFIDVLGGGSGVIQESELQGLMQSTYGGYSNGNTGFNNTGSVYPVPGGFTPNTAAFPGAPTNNAYPVPGGFTQPTNNGFGAPTNNGFGAPTNNGFGAPTNNGFGAPTNNGFGAPPAPTNNGFPGAPTNNGFGAPTNNGFPGAPPVPVSNVNNTAVSKRHINTFRNDLKEFDVSKPYMQNMPCTLVSVVDGDTFKIGVSRVLKDMHKCHSVTSNGNDTKKIVCMINGNINSEDEIIELELLRLKGIDAAEYHILPDENNPRDKGLDTHKQHTTFEGWFAHDLMMRFADHLAEEDAALMVSFNGIDAHGRALGSLTLGGVDVGSVLLKQSFNGNPIAVQYEGKTKSDFSKNLKKYDFKLTINNPEYQAAMKNAIDSVWNGFISSFGNYPKGVSKQQQMQTAAPPAAPTNNPFAPPTNNGFAAPPAAPTNNPFAPPTNNGFAAPTNNGFPGNQPTGGAPAFPNNGFAAPTNNGFGAPTNNGFGAPTNNGFAAPTNNGFGAPTNNGFGAPTAPTNNGFGAPTAPTNNGSSNLPFGQGQQINLLNTNIPRLNTSSQFTMGRNEDDADSDNEVEENKDNKDNNDNTMADMISSQFDIPNPNENPEPVVRERAIPLDEPIVESVDDVTNSLNDFAPFGSDSNGF